MNVWLIPAATATLIFSVALSFIYLVLYVQEKKKYFLLLGIAWAVYGLRFVFVILKINFPRSLFIADMILAIAFINSFLIFLSLRNITGNRNKIRYFTPFAFFLLFIFSNYIFPIPELLTVSVVFFFCGAIYIYKGIKIGTQLHSRTKFSVLVGVFLALWGVHKFNYPFLVNIQWFAPIGYLIGGTLELFTSLFIIMMYYSLSKLEYQKDENRLEDLIQLSAMINISPKDLLNKALDMAIRITESKIGYIYRYDEGTKKFILNTWSKEVMPECQVVEPNMECHLEKAGCWGEAVRQRSAFVINDYSRKTSFIKGTPTGHVTLKRFLTIPVFDNDKIIAVIGVANKAYDYDSADIRQLNVFMDGVWKILERQENEKQLKEAKIKAEESDVTKSVFLANISHELRTPLNGILGMTALLKNENLTADQKHLVELLGKSGMDMHGIVADLLDLTALKDNRMVFHKEWFNFKELIETLINAHQEGMTGAKRLEIQFSWTGEEGLFFGDQARISQCIENILDNSIKFTEKGVIAVHAVIEGKIILEIIDNGIGMDEKTLSRIFSDFGYEGQPFTKNRRGLGLGLSITRSIVEKMGGAVNIQSISGTGTTVRMEFPLEQSLLKLESLKSTVAPGKTEARILVAEDDMINRLYVTRLLKKHGFGVLEAGTGEEVIKIFERQLPDLVLMDIGMPVMDGLQTTRVLKERPQFSTVPIIAVTAHALPSDMDTYRALGMEFLSKPFTEFQLFHKISEMIPAKTP